MQMSPRAFPWHISLTDSMIRYRHTELPTPFCGLSERLVHAPVKALRTAIV